MIFIITRSLCNFSRRMWNYSRYRIVNFLTKRVKFFTSRVCEILHKQRVEGERTAEWRHTWRLGVYHHHTIPPWPHHHHHHHHHETALTWHGLRHETTCTWDGWNGHDGFVKVLKIVPPQVVKYVSASWDFPFWSF